MFFCVHKSTYKALLCTQLDFFMYTRVHNRILCRKDVKAHFIVEVVEAFSICFGHSHYSLTSVM